MGDLTPTYHQSVEPFKEAELSDEAKIKAYAAVTKFISNNTYELKRRFAPESSASFTPRPYVRGEAWFDIYGVITKESIIINSTARVDGNSIQSEDKRLPLEWNIEIFSFATPVDKVSKDLVQIIREVERN